MLSGRMFFIIILSNYIKQFDCVMFSVHLIFNAEGDGLGVVVSTLKCNTIQDK